MRLILALLIAAPAYAGGMAEPYGSAEFDPCADLPTQARYCAMVEGDCAPIWATYEAHVHRMCGTLPAVAAWRAAGFTDATLAQAAFGHQPELPPAPVPLPAPLYLLAAAIMLMRAIKGAT